MGVYGRIYEGTHAAMLLITDAPVGTEFIVTSGTNVGNKYEYRGATAGWVQTSTAAGAANVEPTQLANEQNPGTTNAYGTANRKSKFTIVTADTLIDAAVPQCLYAVTVIVATATAAIEIRHASSAGTGTVLHTIPAGSPVNDRIEFDGAELPNGLYIDYAATATGTLRVAHRAI